ncbi:MAG: nucleotidyltransferase domain-containing protein [Bacteroidota bacterium]
MKEEIISHIEQLEEKEGIRILLAVESGSRAWGFPSPDSDYDVRIIYIRPHDWYLAIENKKDSIEYFHGELLDISGWDIQKALRLAGKSNATLFEWNQSPILYKEEQNFRSDFAACYKAYFQPRHALNHYKGIAKNAWSSLEGSREIKLKRLFYVIRPLLAAKWVLLNDEVPPMNIEPLLDLVEEADTQTKIIQLIQLKSAQTEAYTHRLEPWIEAYIERENAFIENHPDIPFRALPDFSQLNTYFKRLLV